MGWINDDRHNDGIRSVGIMPHKLLKFLIRHFDVMGTSAIDKANDLALFFKNEETIGIFLNPLGYLFEGCCVVAFIGSSFDLKASSCVGRFGVSERAHARDTKRVGASCIAAIGWARSIRYFGLTADNPCSVKNVRFVRDA